MAFWSSDAGRIYNILLSKGVRVVTAVQVKAVCKQAGVGCHTALVGLARAKAVVPLIFRGVYYVRDRQERDLGTIRADVEGVVAQVCSLKLGGDWYFGLATALKLAGIWGQQTQTSVTVITKRRVKRTKSNFAGVTIEFKQLAGAPFDRQIRRRGVLRFSAPSRTVADYAYFGAREEKSREFARAVLADIASKVGGRGKLVKQAGALIGSYPKLYGVYLKRFLKE